jgi:hypothetical protein
VKELLMWKRSSDVKQENTMKRTAMEQEGTLLMSKRNSNVRTAMREHDVSKRGSSDNEQEETAMCFQENS